MPAIQVTQYPLQWIFVTNLLSGSSLHMYPQDCLGVGKDLRGTDLSIELYSLQHLYCCLDIATFDRLLERIHHLADKGA
jgi:hypothetical protein